VTMNRPIAILFARRDSIYRTIAGCDVWDIDRDARRWPGVWLNPACSAALQRARGGLFEEVD